MQYFGGGGQPKQHFPAWPAATPDNGIDRLDAHAFTFDARCGEQHGTGVTNSVLPTWTITTLYGTHRTG